MSPTSAKLNSIAKAKEKLLQELQALEEQEKSEKVNEANAAHRQIIALLDQFAPLFNAKQRNELLVFFSPPAKSGPGAKSGRQDVKPKYQLPHTGQTWSGRGRTPKAFADWEGTVAFSEWKARHPSLKFPLYRD